MKRHLAIDIGSEIGRAIVGFLENGKICTEEIYRFKTQFMQVRDRSLRDFYRYHEEILKALSVYRERYGTRLDSIGVDAWGGDFVLLDRKGNIIRLPESYRSNAETDDVAEIVENSFGTRRLYMRNGNQKMPTDTLHQLIRLRRSDDPSLDDPRALLFVADVFHYLLGADPCCEHSLVSYSRIYNADEDDWDEEIMRAFGLPLHIRSKIVCAGETIGYVNGAILEQAGLEGPVPIIAPCAHDTSCAALSIADLGDDWAFISSGTWSLMGIETDACVRNDISYAYNFSNSSMPLKCNMFKKNITSTWIIQQCSKAWGNGDYNDIVNRAEMAADTDCSIDINATEFYAPEDMPLAISRAVQRDFGVCIDPQDQGAIARIVFASMALKYKYYLTHLLEAAGKEIRRIYILGGGSKNRLINQFTASETGYPVYVGVYEASAVGNLLLQMYGSGELADKADMRRIVVDTFPQTVFAPQGNQPWEQKYKIYQERVLQKNQW